jgi:hypothetical protein
MKAIEVTGTVDDQGNLLLDESLVVYASGPVRIIILCPEEFFVEVEQDSDDTTLEEVRTSLKKALQESLDGPRIPASRMWEGIENPS